VRCEGDQLQIIARGPLVHVMGFEIFVLYIVNELYFRRLARDGVVEEARARLLRKIELIREYELAQGTHARRSCFLILGCVAAIRESGRRRLCKPWRVSWPQCFRGTSNVYLAKKLGLTPIGTMAHEYLQAYQSFGSRLRDFQKAALEGWVQEFRGDLGIALTDVVGMDAFLADFDLYFAKLFDGLRHDSGDPVAWGEKAIAPLP